jgi:F0F1-type ATP synthase beta subunit
MLGIGALWNQNKLTVARVRKTEKCLPTLLSLVQQFTGLENKCVNLEITIRSFKEIFKGKHDDVPSRRCTKVSSS